MHSRLFIRELRCLSERLNTLNLPAHPLQWVPILALIVAVVILVMAAVGYRLTHRRSEGKPKLMSAIEDRLNAVAEQLQGDEGLTGDLEDAPATRLLDWAIAASRSLVQQTEGMDEAAAQQYLDTNLPKFRSVVRQIDRLVGSLPDASPEEAASGIQKVLDAAAQVPTLSTQPPVDVSATAQKIQSQPAEDAVAEVLSLINKG